MLMANIFVRRVVVLQSVWKIYVFLNRESRQMHVLLRVLVIIVLFFNGSCLLSAKCTSPPITFT